MDLNIFTINLLFLAIPGIICYFSLSKLTWDLGKSTYEKVFIIFLLTIFSYLFYDLLIIFPYACFKKIPFEFSLSNIFISKDSVIPVKILIWSSLLSIILAFLLSYILNHNILNRIGQFINVTKKYGDQDVWHYYHNASNSQKNDGWIFVRDHKYNLVYYGYISSWSDSEKDRELIISEVTVFNNDNTDKELYSIDHIYICRNKDDLTIEVPKPISKIKEENNNDTK